jgi:signal transduction histidine kinase
MEDLIGKESIEILFTKKSTEIIRKNIDKNYELPYELTALRKDGTTYPAEVEAREYTYKGRKVRVAALRDISYRKRVEDVLRTSLKMNELLKTHDEQQILDSRPEEAVRLLDSSIGFFHFVNEDQKSVSMQTWSKGTLNNCNVPDKKEHYPISEAGTWIDSYYQRKPVIHNDYESLTHKKGLPNGHFPLERYISLPIIDDDKVRIIFGVGNKNKDYKQFDADILGLLAKSIWMVIQRKRIERELQESNIAKDKFFSIISHDLRSPIGSVQSLIEVLLENMEIFSEEEVKKSISTIGDTVSNAYNLLNNMLLWAQNHRNKIEFSPQVISLKTLVDEVVQVEQIDADKKNIKIIKNIGENIKVKADIDMLSTVFRNLISNAIKFTFKDGIIQISSADYNQIVTQVSINDNGVGIPNNKIDKLFKIDEASSTTGTDNEKGTGLGLILCKEFVERNGGKIWVESKIAKGITFSFTIPTENQ